MKLPDAIYIIRPGEPTIKVKIGTEEKDTTMSEPEMITAKEAREITEEVKISRRKDRQFAEHIKQIDEAIRGEAKQERYEADITLRDVDLGRVGNFLQIGKGYEVFIRTQSLSCATGRSDADLFISWGKKAGQS